MGVKVGLRFTLTQANAADLPALLDLAEAERIDKFYLSHLNYAGRGDRNRKHDAQHRTAREAMDLVFERCWEYARLGLDKEFVTGNNDADGVYLLLWARRNVPGFDEAQLRAKLAEWGGNSSGVNVANIDNLGNVHPDRVGGAAPPGTGRGRPFPEFGPEATPWRRPALRARPRRIKGRCGECS